MTCEDKLRDRLDRNLKETLRGYLERGVPHHTGPKVMRDVIWGFNSYEPFELAIIDSPFFQRLRNLFQTSLALLTYPCAVHSRFEHSLGVATVAARMLDALEERRGRLDPVLRLETRIAALIHDISHGPLSHSSEKFYENLPDEDGNRIFGRSGVLANEKPRLFGDCSASEALGYLMITTPTFGELWAQIVAVYKGVKPDLCRVNLSRMASMVLGVDCLVGPDARFYRQVVNGPFDADKLDYLPRDGYFTGLEIVVDIERLLRTMTVVDKDGATEIGVMLSGASVVEQVLFSKTQLFTTMYHHQKVRAAHQLLQQLLRRIVDTGYKPGGRTLSDPVSFVFLDDYDVLCRHPDHPEIDSMVQRIKERNLPKRALVMGYSCFADDESRDNFNHLDETDFTTFAAQIESDLKLEAGQVIFDLPEPARLLGTGRTQVVLGADKVVELQTLYPAGAWAAAYLGYRKIAYLFTTAKDRRAVGISAMDLFRSQPDSIKLNGNALAFAKC